MSDPTNPDGPPPALCVALAYVTRLSSAGTDDNAGRDHLAQFLASAVGIAGLQGPEFLVRAQALHAVVTAPDDATTRDLAVIAANRLALARVTVPVRAYPRVARDALARLADAQCRDACESQRCQALGVWQSGRSLTTRLIRSWLPTAWPLKCSRCM